MSLAVTHMSLSPKGHWPFSTHCSMHRERALSVCIQSALRLSVTQLCWKLQQTDGILARRVGLSCRFKHFHKEGNELYSKAKQAGCWLPCHSHTASLGIQNRSPWEPLTPVGVWEMQCPFRKAGLGTYRSLQHYCAHLASLPEGFLGLCPIIHYLCFSLYLRESVLEYFLW